MELPLFTRNTDRAVVRLAQGDNRAWIVDGAHRFEMIAGFVHLAESDRKRARLYAEAYRARLAELGGAA